MHNIKEAIYENASKLEGIGEDYQIQVSHDFFLLRTEALVFSSKSAQWSS